MAKTLVIKGANFSTNKLDTVSFSGSVPCTAISLNQSSYELNSIGGVLELVATLTPSNTTDTVSWATSDSDVATVSDGVVTAISLGTATITATCGTQTATCAVTVDNVVPSYVAVCGYDPKKRSSVIMATYTDKNSNETSDTYIIATNQETGLYPIESKSDVDTSPYRFVPIMIPTGATQIKVSCSLGKFYTRTLYFDSTKQETLTNIGAWCVQGVSSGFDQQTSGVGPYTFDIPTNVSGLDSVCFSVATGGDVSAGVSGENYASSITIEFLIGT